jgi:hypothetical protein
MSTMKISPQKKIFVLSCLSAILSTIFWAKPSYAWSGYDYENKSEIEIDKGNYVQEGYVIQFYDAKEDNYHSAKVLFREEVANGTRLQVQDLNTHTERNLIMRDE